MDEESKQVFIFLYKEAAEKCFGYLPKQSLTETESRLFYNQVFEQTGLVVGWKSLKNYSLFVFNQNVSKEENPSTATLDTLARYVLNAPYTTETDRKAKENHFPFWFQYKEQKLQSNKAVPSTQKKHASKRSYLISIITALVIITIIIYYLFKNPASTNFTDNFFYLSDDSLKANGWFIKDKEATSWNKRAEDRNALSLFTLTGDNWPDSLHASEIKNLLLRKIASVCFTTEVHLQHFFPKQEWQQAGILLMEDTNYTSKSLRLSIAYNDFFGGFARPKEVIIQAITSPGNGLSQPEEIVHLPVFTLDSNNNDLVNNNLAYSALRIEKTGNKFRLLYSCTPNKNFAFKDAAVTDLNFQPKYIGLFALKGFSKKAEIIPAKFTYFALAPQPCK